MGVPPISWLANPHTLTTGPGWRWASPPCGNPPAAILDTDRGCICTAGLCRRPSRGGTPVAPLNVSACKKPYVTGSRLATLRGVEVG